MIKYRIDSRIWLRYYLIKGAAINYDREGGGSLAAGV